MMVVVMMMMMIMMMMVNGRVYFEFCEGSFCL